MKRLKRLISMALCMCVLCGIVFTQAGCLKRTTETYVVGDFRIIKVRADTNKEMYKDVYIIYDFTEEAKQKENIILPCEFNGKAFACFDSHSLFSIYGEPFNCNFKMEKSKMKKAFFVGHYPNVIDKNNSLGAIKVILSKALYKAPLFEKNIFNEYYYSWVLFYTNFMDLKDGECRIKTYINVDYFNIITYQCFIYEDTSYSNFNERTGYKIEMINNYGWSNSCNFIREQFALTTRVANVHFMYNYEDSPKYGYYWIDDIENGEKIEVVPENPTREGYAFGGWYTEPECINEFNFDTPITKQEVDWERVIYLEETLPEDYITFLYAKWIEN